MKRLPIFLLAFSLLGCNKPQTLRDCNSYQGVYTPLTIVPGIALGLPVDSVLSSRYLSGEPSVVGRDPLEVRVDGLFVGDVAARYTLYADSVGLLRYVEVVPSFEPRDTAEAYRVLQSVLASNYRTYGTPKKYRASPLDEYSAYAYEWVVCDGIHEVLQCATNPNYSSGGDSVTRWMLITISY